MDRSGLRSPVASRRTVLAAGAVGGLATAVAAPGLAARAGTTNALVRHGEGVGQISVAVGAEPHAVHCAQTLRDHIAACTGAALEIIEGEPAADHPVVYVDWIGQRAPASVPGQLDGLDADGFVLATDAGVSVIVGPSTYGTEFGVYEFLERHLDVRWLAPSAPWTVTPPAPDLVVPAGSEAQAPAFGDRIVSPYAWPITWETSGEWYEWTNRSRFRRRDGALGYGHNLFRAFPPATYAADHPEFYPILNGVRRIPSDTDRAGWQPRFTAAGTVEAAADYIRRILADQPDLPAVSLAINDSSNFSEDERQFATIGPSGSWSWSQLYYGWVNQVAELLEPEHGDKGIGVLAYAAVEEPPSFDLHPMVRPVLCRDIQALSRADSAAEWADLHSRWRQRSNNLGSWMYAYGGSFALPRVQLRNDAAALRSLHQDYQVDRIHVEMQPEFGEGPKPWVYSRLAWDPTLDADDLVDDWCRHAVGAQAGPALADYFRGWEELWDTAVPQTDWFDLSRANPFFYFDGPGYIEAVLPEDLPPLEALIDQVVATADTADGVARAQFLRRSMDYYGAVVRSYPRDEAAIPSPGRGLKLAKSALNDVDTARAADQLRRACLTEFAGSELTSRASSAVTNGMAWSGTNLYRAWRLADHIIAAGSHSNAVRHCITRHTSIGSPAQREYATWILALADGQVLTRGHNAGFEDGLESWTTASSVAPREEIDLAEAPTFDGSGMSLRVPGGSRMTFKQTLTDVTPGPLFTTMHCLSTMETEVPDPEQGSVIRTYWHLYDTANKLIEKRSGRLFELASAQGQWQEIRMADVLPENIGRVIITYEFRPSTYDSTTYLDAGEFWQLSG